MGQAPGPGGIINANVDTTTHSGAQLVIDIATRNQGTIEATNKGRLQINGSVINNTGGGVIRTVGTSSTVGIGTDSTIIGGTLTTSFGEILITGTNVTFDGGKSVVPTNAMITNSADVEVISGGELNLKGTINNNGVFAGISPTLVLQPLGSSSTVTLKGSGSMHFIGNCQITGGGTAVTLDNVSNLIEATSGTIGGMGLKLKNEAGGTIDADGGTLIIDTGASAVTNAGALETGLGTLVIASNLTNTGKLNANGGTMPSAQ